MENENWFGRDMDEAAMATDNRPLLEQAKSLVKRILDKKCGGIKSDKRKV